VDDKIWRDETLKKQKLGQLRDLQKEFGLSEAIHMTPVSFYVPGKGRSFNAAVILGDLELPFNHEIDGGILRISPTEEDFTAYLRANFRTAEPPISPPAPA
jgi:hypothetical protein